MALFLKLHDNTLPFWNNDSERQSKSIMVANSIPHESEFQYLRRVMIVKIFIDARATGGIQTVYFLGTFTFNMQPRESCTQNHFIDISIIPIQ